MEHVQVVTVIGQSGVVTDIGICDDAVELGCTQKGLPSTARTHLEGHVLSAQGSPLMLAFAGIAEDSEAQGSLNTLTVVLTPAAGTSDFTAGSRVTVTGLTNAEQASTDSLAIASNRLSLFGQWNKDGGQLTIELSGQPVKAGERLLFSFAIRNSATRQDPRTPSVRVVGGRQDSLVWGQSPMTCATLAGCTGVLASASPIAISAARVWESTRHVNAVNVVSLFVRANVPLLTKRSRLVIHGLSLYAQVCVLCLRGT